MKITFKYYSGLEEDLYTMVASLMSPSEHEIFSNMVSTTMSFAAQAGLKKEDQVYVDMKLRAAALAAKINNGGRMDVSVDFTDLPTSENFQEAGFSY